MNKTLSLLLSRRASYVLCCVAVVLSFFVSDGPRWILLLSAGACLILETPATKTWLKRVVLPLSLVAVLILTSGRARAQFAVIDPAAIAQMGRVWAQDISTYQKIIEEVQVATKIYNTGMQDYQLAMTMAQAIQSKNLYAIRGAVSMGNTFVADHFGESTGWSTAMNLGLNIPTAYNSSTLPMMASSTFLASQKLGSSSHLADLSRIGISDDTSQRTMALIAQLSRMQSTNAGPIAQWEASVHSTVPALNTAAAQQNLTNIGMVQMYEQGRATLAVNSLLAQQMMLQSMKDRNASVSSLNLWQGVADNADNKPFQLGGMEQALHNHIGY